jgi:hypothetical protein
MCELSHEKPTQVFESAIDLGEDRLGMVLEYYADEKDDNDEAIERKNVYNYYRVSVKRSQVYGVELRYKEQHEVWQLKIFCWGVSSDIQIFYDTQERADHFYKLVHAWIFHAT